MSNEYPVVDAGDEHLSIDARGTVAKYVDPAMFKAEAMPSEAMERPTVHLLWMTADPLGAAAAMNAMYTGKVRRSLSDVTHAEREALIPDMQATALKAPFESIKLHFLIEGVTRAFTHQLVRQRTAVYAQESLRFATMDSGVPVGLPPSLREGRTWRQMMDMILNDSPHLDSSVARNMVQTEARPVDRARWKWDEAVSSIDAAYAYLVAQQIPAEDARGLLPTNTLTRIHYVTDLRNLHAHAGTRLSTQAQFEWKEVWRGIILAIRNYNPMEAAARSMEERFGTEEADMPGALRYVGLLDAWQYKVISEIFRPICYYTGKCEFMAKADRACTIRDRVEANHAIGRPSTEWHRDLIAEPEDEPFLGRADQIEAIHPTEWFDDPTAAR